MKLNYIIDINVKLIISALKDTRDIVVSCTEMEIYNCQIKLFSELCEAFKTEL